MIETITAVYATAAWIVSTLVNIIVWGVANPWLAGAAAVAAGVAYLGVHHIATSLLFRLITWPFRAAWRAIRNRPGRVRRAARRMSDPNATSKQRSAAAAIVSAAQRGST